MPSEPLLPAAAHPPAADAAQLEIRRYAIAVERLFAEQMPVTHAAFVANDRTAP